MPQRTSSGNFVNPETDLCLEAVSAISAYLAQAEAEAAEGDTAKLAAAKLAAVKAACQLVEARCDETSQGQIGQNLVNAVKAEAKIALGW